MTAILTDIEGTTSSISFVKDVLFPYSRRHLAGFVTAHAHRPEVAALLEDTRALAGRADAQIDAVIATLLAWIDADRKAPPLKALQGMIWEDGYRRGEYRGHVYPDAVAALRRWHAAGIAVFVYSSGSVAAQQLLFAHSEHGDLTPLFAGHFDTRVGAKAEVSSYRAISAAVAMPPADMVFLSDTPAELDAAATAGMTPIQLRRDGAPPASAYRTVSSFADLGW
jgi:enolase-phosphatase E1